MASVEKALISAGQQMKEPVAFFYKRLVKTSKGGPHTPTNPRNYYVRGSKRLAQIPSARFIGPYHFHLLEKGHRIVVTSPKLVVDAPVYLRRRRFGKRVQAGTVRQRTRIDSLKNSKAFNVLPKVRFFMNSRMFEVATRTLRREYEKAVIFAAARGGGEGAFSQRRKEFSESYVRRIARQEIRKYERQLRR